MHKSWIMQSFIILFINKMQKIHSIFLSNFCVTISRVVKHGGYTHFVRILIKLSSKLCGDTAQLHNAKEY